MVAFYSSPDVTQLAVVGFDSGARALTCTVASIDEVGIHPLHARWSLAAEIQRLLTGLY